MKIKFAIVLAILVYLLSARFCFGVDVSIGYGNGIKIWHDEGVKYTVAQLTVSDEIRHPWYGSVVVIGMQCELDTPRVIDDSPFSYWSNGMVITSRVEGRWKLYKNIVGRLFGGFGILIGELPEIGDSGIIGHFGVRISYSIGQWEVGYEAWHLSDPLTHGDSGWEAQLLVVSRSF